MLLLHLLQRKADLAVLSFDDLCTDMVTEMHHFLHGLYKSLLELGNVDHAVIATTEIDDRAEFKDLDDRTFHDLTHFEFFGKAHDLGNCRLHV